jgi:hypothetical protein
MGLEVQFVWEEECCLEERGNRLQLRLLGDLLAPASLCEVEVGLRRGKPELDMVACGRAKAGIAPVSNARNVEEERMMKDGRMDWMDRFIVLALREYLLYLYAYTFLREEENWEYMVFREDIQVNQLVAL